MQPTEGASHVGTHSGFMAETGADEAETHGHVRISVKVRSQKAACGNYCQGKFNLN